jgi:hypothetical protein
MNHLETRKIVLGEGVEDHLRQFLRQSTYASHGGVITDLDGTIVHEDRGRVYIPEPVEFALKELYDLGRPLIINTMRFPLSVIRTFGKEWYAIANSPIPTVTLNGSSAFTARLPRLSRQPGSRCLRPQRRASAARVNCNSAHASFFEGGGLNRPCSRFKISELANDSPHNNWIVEVAGAAPNCCSLIVVCRRMRLARKCRDQLFSR